MAELSADPTVKLGLLLEAMDVQRESAGQAVRQLAQHTEGLDAVVREEIGLALREEFAGLTAEVLAAQKSLRALARAAAARQLLGSLALGVLAAVTPLLLAQALLPGPSEVQRLREQAQTLQQRLQQLHEAGADAELRRCGPARRLCIRIENTAGGYGSGGEFRIVKGH